MTSVKVIESDCIIDNLQLCCIKKTVRMTNSINKKSENKI